jgi:ubiquitin carboxyl-terminal hydrolase 36/42
MSGENQVFCDRCRKKTNALARPHPIRLAEYLLITIGLFEYSGGGKKIKKPLNFEFTINFSKILPNENAHDENYELYGFIVHIGNEVERGHYICYARNLEENPTVWYCFDDAFVTER